MPEQPPAVVVCIRDPDYDNEYGVFGDVRIVDIDLGRSDLSDEETWESWSTSHLEEAAELRALGAERAAAYIEEAVNGAAANFDHDD